MRAVSLCISTAGIVAALAGCSDSPSSTGETGPRLLASRSGGDSTGQSSHYISNGATADVWWSSGGTDSLGGPGGGWTYGYLSVNRNSQVNDEWTVINWSISTCDAYWNCSYSSGYGYVHGAALSGRGGADLRLAIDPADYPENFYTYGDPVGPIELHWRQAAGYSVRTSGNSHYSYPGYSYRSNGVTESSTAAVSGHVGSFALPPGTGGNMGTSHSMTISFSH